VKQKIDEIPDPFIGTAQQTLVALCAQFVASLNAYTTGNNESTELFQDGKKTFGALKEEIIGTKLSFDLNESDEEEIDSSGNAQATNLNKNIAPEDALKPSEDNEISDESEDDSVTGDDDLHVESSNFVKPQGK